MKPILRFNNRAASAAFIVATIAILDATSGVAEISKSGIPGIVKFSEIKGQAG